MPARTTRIEETQIIKDILRQLRRHRANEISQEPIWTHDTFTAPATYQLTSIPYGINALADNQSMLSEGTDYTVDYATGLITFAVGRTAGHVIFVSYVTNGELVAASGPVDTGGVTDTFDRADSATSLGVTSDGFYTWQALNGTWGISGNKGYLATPPGSGYGLAVVNAGVADCTVQIDLSYPSAGDLTALAFRVVDKDNFWWWGHDPNSPGTVDGVWKRVAGSDTLVSQNTLTIVSSVLTVSVVLSGSSIILQQRGTTVTTVTDSTFSTATKFGLMSLGNVSARFDNLSVTIP